jgi:hypothetical protein
MTQSNLIAFRCPAHLRAEVAKAIARHNKNPGQRDCLNFTSFMLRALKEKIQHLERSRRKIKKVVSKTSAFSRDCGRAGGPHNFCLCRKCVEMRREVAS